MDLGNFKLKVELCELENVAWYITFQDFILTPQKPNFSISDDLFDDKEIMVDPLRSQKLFQPKKNLFHYILLSNQNIRKKKFIIMIINLSNTFFWENSHLSGRRKSICFRFKTRPSTLSFCSLPCWQSVCGKDGEFCEK